MPGKYSHNVVLSQYSSQGIISLPNGQQLDYFTQASQFRASSASNDRQRTPSNVTESSRQGTSSNKSIQSVPPTSKPPSYDLSLRKDRTPRQRLVIVESDGEGEPPTPLEQTVEGQRSSDGVYLSSNGQGHRTNHSALKTSSPQYTSPRANARPQLHNGPPHIHDSRNGGHNVDLIPGRRPKSRVGVKAFIQARYNAEVAKEDENTTTQGKMKRDETKVESITLRDFIKTEIPRQEPRPERTARDSQGRGMSLRDFMKVMPNPDAGNEADSEDSVQGYKASIAKVKASEPAEHLRMSRASEPAERPRTWKARESAEPPRMSKARERFPAGSDVYARRLEEVQRRDFAAEPNFDGFDDSEEQSDYMSGLVVPPQARLRREKSYDIATDASLPARLPGPASRMSGSETEPVAGSIEAGKPAQGQAPEDSFASRPLIAVPRTHKALISASAFRDRNGFGVQSHTSSHTEPQLHPDSASSQRSDDSSMLGLSTLSSIGQLTNGTSRVSPNSEATSQRGALHSWGLPRIDRVDEPTNDFSNIFTDMNNSAILFTSDEDETSEEDTPDPRLQILHGGVPAPSRQFGMISAGKDFTANKKDADDLSDMSAAFPPDIGKYNRNGESSASVTRMMRGIPEETERPNHSLDARTNKLRKSKTGGGGLLGRIRVKKDSR